MAMKKLRIFREILLNHDQAGRRALYDKAPTATVVEQEGNAAEANPFMFFL